MIAILFLNARKTSIQTDACLCKKGRIYLRLLLDFLVLVTLFTLIFLTFFFILLLSCRFSGSFSVSCCFFSDSAMLLFYLCAKTKSNRIFGDQRIVSGIRLFPYCRNHSLCSMNQLNDLAI